MKRPIAGLLALLTASAAFAQTLAETRDYIHSQIGRCKVEYFNPWDKTWQSLYTTPHEGSRFWQFRKEGRARVQAVVVDLERVEFKEAAHPYYEFTCIQGNCISLLDQSLRKDTEKRGWIDKVRVDCGAADIEVMHGLDIAYRAFWHLQPRQKKLF